MMNHSCPEKASFIKGRSAAKKGMAVRGLVLGGAVTSRPIGATVASEILLIICTYGE
jgi:hypothetical protein